MNLKLTKKKMVTKKDWSEFRSTGLVTIINQILHIFGWAIVFEINIDTDEIVNVFPARVKFRGFDNQGTTEAYQKISKYMLDNASELNYESYIKQKK
jgi:hypothetical protein